MIEKVCHRLASFWCSDQYLSIYVRKLPQCIDEIPVIVLEEQAVWNEYLVKFSKLWLRVNISRPHKQTCFDRVLKLRIQHKVFLKGLHTLPVPICDNYFKVCYAFFSLYTCTNKANKAWFTSTEFNYFISSCYIRCLLSFHQVEGKNLLAWPLPYVSSVVNWLFERLLQFFQGYDTLLLLHHNFLVFNSLHRRDNFNNLAILSICLKSSKQEQSESVLVYFNSPIDKHSF